MIKKFLALAIISILNLPAFAQTGTIRGLVINARTSEPLPYAIVFINYTTLWTTANEQGEFLLRNIPFGQHELAATFVGHQPFQTRLMVKDTIPKSITLKLDSNPLREVQVRSKRDKEWNRQYERFQKLFLGNSAYASACKILNPWVLEFTTDEKGFFIATSPEILEIENHSLGYKLFYQLKTFSYGSAQFTISGSVRFEVIETNDSTINEARIKNRQDVYEGSVRHLLRSIFDGSTNHAGFALYRDETFEKHIIRMATLEANVGKGISHYSFDNLTFEELSPNNFKIYFPKRLEIHYLNKLEYAKIYRNVNHPVSWLEITGGYLLINNRGIVLNPSKLVLSGNMSEARIAELLPYDFQPLESISVQPPHAEVLSKKKALNPFTMLLEKPYVHTDRSYYYPREMLWFRGYMSYAEPIFSDSLSKVIYIELIDSSANIVARKILPIVQGSVEGNLAIPPTLMAGDYILRAYTRWMLNFDPSLIFTRPIKILEYTEIGRRATEYKPAENAGGLRINLEKDSFEPREKITVTLGVMNDLELLKPASFSISVTDMNQAAPAENETSILTAFAIPDIHLPEGISSERKFPVQHGIDFKGRLFTRKGKPIQGTLTVELENSRHGFTITTQENGVFSFNDLQLYDSSRLYVLPVTSKGLIGKVVMDSTCLIAHSHSVAPLEIEVLKSENPSRYNSWESFANARILNEVVIEETRLENQDRTASIVAADYAITGKSLRDSHATDLMMVLQSKVPGLRVIAGKIVLGSPGTFGNPEALVLIDGLAVNGSANSDGASEQLQGGALDRISHLTAQEIEKIEVFKYSSGSAYGSRGANGVISITTRKVADGAINRNNAGKGKYQEIQIPRFSTADEFVAPDYSTTRDADARPDYRSTIFWAPHLPTDKNNVAEATFYAADLETRYRIVVEGITRDGSVVRGEKVINIKGRH